MKNHYVTFGQTHTHRINGITLDCDTVAVFKAESSRDGREKAWEYFSDKFFTDFHDTEWDEDKLKYFPKGYIYI